MFLTKSLAAPLLTAALLGCVAGCSQSKGQPMSAGASQVSSGDKVISYAAPHDGKIFLRDDTDNKVVYSADIRRDQIAKFDPDLPEVSINGTIATIPNQTHAHSWYFERGDTDRVQAASAAPANENGGVQTIHVPLGVKVDVQTQPSN